MSAAVSLPTERVHLRVLTNSELRAYRSCARRHHYAYGIRRRPRESAEVLRFGILWHLGQEAWWKADAEPAARLEAALLAMRGAGDADPFHLVVCEELMLAYTARWGDADLRTVAVEQQFEVPLLNPETGSASRTFRLGGKLDGIVAEGSGRLLVLEHKTTQSDIEAGSSYWARVRALDTQVSLYLAGAKAAGYAVEACLYDVVRRPGLKPLRATPVESRKYTAKGLLYANQREKDESPEEYRLRVRADIAERPERYLARGELVRLESEERESAFDTWQTARLLREAELAGFAPKNPDACTSFGGCPYLAVCQGEASIDDDGKFRTAETAHEELANDT